MCDITLYTNTQVQGVPKEDRKDQKKKILKEIMAKNFPYGKHSTTHQKVQLQVDKI